VIETDPSPPLPSRAPHSPSSRSPPRRSHESPPLARSGLESESDLWKDTSPPLFERNVERLPP
jgi:hypothetical protein